MKTVLYGVASVCWCLRVLLVYLQPPTTFPLLHMNRAAAQSWLVAVQQRSIVLRQSPFQGHIITALDTAWSILVSAEQTGISSARINHFMGRGLLCPVASCLMFNVCGHFQ